MTLLRSYEIDKLQAGWGRNLQSLNTYDMQLLYFSPVPHAQGQLAAGYDFFVAAGAGHIAMSEDAGRAVCASLAALERSQARLHTWTRPFTDGGAAQFSRLMQS